MAVKLSIIILNWNSKSYIDLCLQSVRKAIPSKLKNEIIVIDNGSTDSSIQYIKKQYPDVKLIENDRNKGVAPARNQGLMIAKGKYILLLDIDTIIREDSIEVMIQTMQSDNRIGLCGPKLVGTDGKLQFSCRNFPSVLSKIYRQFPGKLQNCLLEREELRNWDHCSQREVGYVIGACQLIRKAVIKEVGLLDENIFYGPEDIDFCLRIWQAGYKVVYNPEAVIIHDEQRITKRKLFSKICWEHAKGLAYFFWKHKYLFSRKSLYKSISNNVL